MGVVVGVASIPIKLDFSGVSKQVSQGGKEAAEGFTRDVNGRLRDSRGKFVKTGEDVGDNIKKGVDKKGKDAADGLTSHFKGAFGKIAALGSGLFIGSQLISGLKSAFAEAADAQKVGALTEQVIKTTGGAAKITAKQVGDLSSAISKKTAIDDEAIQSGANLLLTFSKVRNEAGKGNDIFNQTVAVANDMSVALGQDMKSSSLQLGKALNDPIKGVTALSRAGVSFTAEQKEQIKTLQESGDILGAQKIILREVGSEFGGAAQAAATPVEQLKVTWGNLLEEIGTRAMPIVTKLAEWVGERLPGAFDAASRAVGRVAAFLAPAIATLKEFFYTLTSGFFEDEGTPVEEFALRVRDAIADIIDLGKKLVPVIIDIVKNFTFIGLIVSHFEGFKQVVGTAVDVLGRLFDVVGKVFKVFSEHKELFAIVGAGILHFLIPAVISSLMPVAASTTAWLANAAAVILANAPLIAISLAIGALVAGVIYAYNHFEVFRNVVDTVARVIKDVAVKAFEGMIMLWDNYLLPGIQKIAHFFVNVLWPAVQIAWDGILAVVDFAWNNVLKPIFAILQWYVEHVLVNAFKVWKFVVVDLVIPLIIAVIKEAWDILKVIFDAIGWVVEHVLGPIFKVFMAIATHVWSVIADGVSAAWSLIQPVFEAVRSWVADKLTPVWDGLVAAARVAWNALPGLIQGALRLVGGIVAGFLDGVGSIADAIGLDDIAKVLRNGASSARGWGQGSVSNNTGQGQGGISVQGGVRRATGGPIPGSGRGDHVKILGEPGEFMQQRKAVDYYGLPFMEAVNERRLKFAAGGLIPDLGDIARGAVDKARGLGTAALESRWPMMATGGGAFTKTGLPAGAGNYIREAIFKLIRGKESEGKYAGSGPVGGAGAVAAAAWIRIAMGLTNTPDSWFDTLMARAKLESGFNPRAINLWDSNAKKGTPSKGLFQTIDGTFNRYKLPGHGDIWNPVDNAAAAMQYIKARYGSIFNINPRTGYAEGGLVHLKNFDGGGVLAPGWNAVNNQTGGYEHVVPARGAPLVENFYANSREDVAEFWQRAEFHAMAGSFG